MDLKKIYFFLFTATLAALFCFCERTQPEANSGRRKVPPPLPNEKVATFAEGCFWHSELVFQSLIGVREAVSGYTGGDDPNPFYEKVSAGETGHAESVQVYYDSTKISYETLVKVFFASHDPTSLNRQGQDIGTEYRSMIFYQTQKEKIIIEEEIQTLIAERKYKNKIVTEVVASATFYPAEEFHQEYVRKNPNNDYVKYVSIPDFLFFKVNFNGNFKPITYL